MNAKQLQWWNESIEVQTPVDVAEQFELWTVVDESHLIGLVGEIGWERWEYVQNCADKERGKHV